MNGTLVDGQAAIVTGGAQGVGLAIAALLAEHGASVVVSDINSRAAAQSADELAAKGHRAIAVTCDVTDEAAMESLVDTCQREFGSVDIMVNNAGITRDATMPKMSLADFRTVLDVHLTGAWLGTRAAARIMRAQRRGCISYPRHDSRVRRTTSPGGA